MRTVRISLKTAEKLVRFADVIKDARPDALGGGWDAVWRELRAAMKPKRSLAPARKRREKKKASKKEETQTIREEVMRRAGALCECGCGVPFTDLSPAELDHFWGRGKRQQTVENCWALSRACHRAKTNNEPSASFWLERYIEHCRAHGYTSEVGPAAARWSYVMDREALARKRLEVAR